MAKKGAKGGKGAKSGGGGKAPQKPNKLQVRVRGDNPLWTLGQFDMHSYWLILVIMHHQGDVLKEQLPPQERVDAVRPLWESLSQKDRVAMLTIDVETLREKARELTDLAKQQGG